MFNNDLPWNLDHHRYAVLGVPRSGTQLLESFIKYSLSKKDSNVVALQEIFSMHVVMYSTLLLENNLLRMAYQPSNITNIKDSVKDKLETIKRGDPNQALVCRAFLDTGLSLVSFTESLAYLQNLNFKFIYINRRFDHKILSAMFAMESFIFMGVKNTTTLTIDIDALKTFIMYRYLIEQHHLNLMKVMIPEFHVVEYDSLVEKANNLSPIEREAAFGIYKEKQLPMDPYEQVENSEEVKKVFAEFYPKLQSLRDTLLA
jgi:hypothetical protein